MSLGVVNLVVLAYAFRQTTKNSSTFWRKKVHPIENPGHAYDQMCCMQEAPELI